MVINNDALGLGDGKLAGDWVGRQYWGSLRPQCHSAPGVIRDPVARLAVEAEGVVVEAEARRGEVMKPFDVRVVPELL